MRRSLIVVSMTVMAWAPAQANNLGDPANGQVVFEKCSACHQVGAEARNRIGPQLNDLFGRSAGAVDGFRYSAGFKAAADDGLLWENSTLDQFVADPKSVIARNRMRFAGLKDPQDRLDVLAYLRQFSAEAGAEQPVAVGMAHSVASDILAIEGDPAYGEYLSGDCTSCHQVNGATPGIPAIVGWPASEFVTAMHAYKDSARIHPVMQMMAGRLSNEEIAALAACFESVE